VTKSSSLPYGLLNNPGIIEQATYKRHTGRINLEADVKPWLTLGANINGVVSKTDIGTNIIDDVFTFAAASTPGMVLRAPDGRFGSPNNPEDDPQSNNATFHRAKVISTKTASCRASTEN
jgi:hypothetical protein